ncbi:MAG: glycosyltransferase family 39 protein [Candidatus Levyibacteriota bacterium]|nr:MAG: glycosyltransferase family 39 protein [Candidatus Levybacteria bacterium]
MFKKIIIFIFIVFIASVLRLWQLGNIPPSPDWDEAALAYSAYSIMQTGKDEYGISFPIILRSFDDYKPALYSYIAIPFIKIFGLNVIAIRLPSAVFGITTIIAVYFLMKELFKNTTLKLEIGNWKLEIPEVAMLLLAISPWHLQFSRIAFESNLGLSLNIFAIFLFVKGLKKPMLLPFSAFFLGLSLYAYQSEKVFVPLLCLILVLVYRKTFFRLPKKYIIFAFFIGIALTVPIAYYTFTQKAALARAQGVSIFTESTPFVKQYTKRIVIDKKNHDIFGFFVDNRRIAYVKAVIDGYLSHYNLYWLFLSGDISRHHAPEMGLLYLWELPFLFIGIYQMVFGFFPKNTKYLIFLWFFAAPIPASVTTGVPHAVRTLNFLPTFQIFIAIGLIAAFAKISSIKYQVLNIIGLRYTLISCFLLMFTFNFLYYLNQYFVQQNNFYSESWQYGYKEAIDDVKKIENRYQKVIVSNQPHLDQSYMFFLFYLQYPPNLYQEEAKKNNSGGFAETHQFGKYIFRPIVWENEKKDGKTLYVGRQEDFHDSAHVIKKIFFLNGKAAISIVDG